MTRYTDAVDAVIAYWHANLPAQTLGRTTFAALAYETTNDHDVVMVATAGAGATGLSGPAIDALQAHLTANGLGEFIVVSVAMPLERIGTWHINDAEMQLLRGIEAAEEDQSALQAAVLCAIGATRRLCANCHHFVGQAFAHLNLAQDRAWN